MNSRFQNPQVKSRLRFLGLINLLLLFVCAGHVGAIATGKIVGRVTDAETGEALVGVNVVLVGTTTGAATDLNGEFMILNVPVGTYRVRATMMGYAPTVVEEVKVLFERTTRVDIALRAMILEGQEVTIVATRPLIEKDATTSMNILGQQEIKSLPVDDHNTLLAITPGVTRDARGFHLRGGRQRETVYLIDGLPVQQPNYATSFSGYSALNLNQTAIAEMVVQTGGFNAEYGNALSGVVAVTTQSGSESFNGLAEVESEIDADNGPHHRNYYTGFRRYRLSLGGPAPFLSGSHLRYFVSGEYTRADDGFPSREFVDTDFSDYVLNGKLNYDLTSSIKLDLTGMMARRSYFLYDARREFIPETYQRRLFRLQQASAKLTYALRATSLFELQLGYSSSYYKAAQPGKWWDIIQPEDWNVIYNSDDRFNSPAALDLNFKTDGYFVTAGDNNLLRESTTLTYLARGSYLQQAGKHHQFKTGFEINVYDLQYVAVLAFNGFPFTYAYGFGRDDMNLPRLYPKLYAAYVQDKIEFEGLIINAGVRFEAFDPDASLPRDEYRPYYDRLPYGPPDPFNPDPNWMGPNRDIPRPRDWRRASVKTWWSPRLGVSHPIHDRHALHFTVGTFYQVPDFYNLYRNYNYSYDLLALGGNPDLEPERTTSYEVGISSAIYKDLVSDFTVFYKDISNLVETVAINDPNDPKFQAVAAADTDNSVIKSPVWYNNKNVAWGSVRGFEINLRKRPQIDDRLSLSLAYTFMVAKGKTSDYHDGFLRQFQRNQLPPVQQYYLDWDQRHSVSANVAYQVRDNWSVSLLFNYGSGLPYTGLQESLIPVENNKRLPETKTLDARVSKVFRLRGGRRAEAYVLGLNIFDWENVVNFDEGENRRIPIVAYLEKTGDFAGPLNDPTVFGSHREIKLGLAVRW